MIFSPDSDAEDHETAPPDALAKKEEPKRKDVEVCECVRVYFVY